MEEDPKKHLQAIIIRLPTHSLAQLKEAFKLTPSLMQITDSDKRTLFFWACAEGKLEIAEYFHSLGSDINHRDGAQWTPLHVAASRGHSEIVAFLLKHGAHVNVQTSGKQTPLHYAASKGHAKVVELLLDYTPDSDRFEGITPETAIKVNMVDNTGSTPLIRAVINGSKAIVQMLLLKGADMQVKDIEGNTAFHHACYEEKTDIAILLANAGADYKVTNNEGKTPLEAGPMELGLKLHSLKYGSQKE